MASSFLNLNEFAAKQGIHRHTAREKLKNREYYSLNRGKTHLIPSFYEQLKSIKDYEEELENKKARTYTISNNKGGTGKTTSIINIAASLASFGKKVLIIDADTQSNASTIDGIHTKYDFRRNNLTKIMIKMKDGDSEKLKKRLQKSIVPVENEILEGSLDVLPNSILWDEESEVLFSYPNAENILSRIIKPIEKDYDFILIDTHPSMDVIWRMSIMASDGVILAIKPENYSLEGFAGIFSRMYRLNDEYIDRKGHDIEVIGSIVTSFRGNTNNDKAAIENAIDAMDKYPKYNEAELLEPYISYTIKASEQQSLSGPIMFDEPNSKMCLEYLELTANILKRAYYLELSREERKDDE